MSTQKALALAVELRDLLVGRFTTVDVIAIDTASIPSFTVTQGTLAAGQQAATVRVRGILPLGTDSLGLAARVYANHVVQIVLETSSIASVALMTEALKSQLFSLAALLGTRVEIYLQPNATAATFGGSPTLVATIDGLEPKYRGMIGQ